jgi:pilus assembly protein Flp/PilA
MHDLLLMLAIKLRVLLSDEGGQDMIEYALLVALIAFGSTATMSAISTAVSNVFTQIGSTITNATA